jgi:type 1 fimbriae regulatory protein FimB
VKSRLYLTQHETEQILRATEGEKNGLRDRCMILMCFYHGLRISELLGLTVRDIDLAGGSIFIRRLKNGFSTVHPLQPEERQLLGEWMSRRPPSGEGWLFPNAKGKHLTRQYLYKLLRRYGLLAGLAVRVHPHMLRHACGYELAEQGMDTRLIQDYLGHRNIRHTVHYTAGNAARFAQTWKKQRLAIVNSDDGLDGERVVVVVCAIRALMTLFLAAIHFITSSFATVVSHHATPDRIKQSVMLSTMWRSPVRGKVVQG